MTMATLSDRIRTTLEQLGTECPLEEVVDLCPEVTWNQVFLSRTGQVHVKLDANRTYWVQTYRRDEGLSRSPADTHAIEHELSAS
jgi:hypothetical protein